MQAQGRGWTSPRKLWLHLASVDLRHMLSHPFAPFNGFHAQAPVDRRIHGQRPHAQYRAASGAKQDNQELNN